MGFAGALRGCVPASTDFPSSERSPWHTCGAGRRPRQTFRPEVILSPFAWGGRAGGCAFWCCEAKPRGRASRPRSGRDPCWHRGLRRPQSFLPQKQRGGGGRSRLDPAGSALPISHPHSLAVPVSATFPQEGPGWGNLRFGRNGGRRQGRMPPTKRRSGGHRAPFPIPHPSPPPVRPPPAPCSRLRLPSRGHRWAPPRGGCPGEASSVTGEVPRALGYPLS